MMATTNIPHASSDTNVYELSPEEEWTAFDRQARRYLNMSGQEFKQAWDAGELDADADRPEVMRVALLMPLAR